MLAGKLAETCVETLVVFAENVVETHVVFAEKLAETFAGALNPQNPHPIGVASELPVNRQHHSKGLGVDVERCQGHVAHEKLGLHKGIST